MQSVSLRKILMRVIFFVCLFAIEEAGIRQISSLPLMYFVIFYYILVYFAFCCY